MATMLNPNAIQKGSITKDMIYAPVLDAKQNITDESLTTISKTIVGAINEVYNGGLKDASITTSNIEDGAITEEKLDTALTAKVNNNVKTVEQALTDAQIAIASKNLKFRDDNGNFFADKASYDAIAALEHKPSNSVFGVGCTGNTFNTSDNIWFENYCKNNTVGSNNRFNAYGNYCINNVTGMNCRGNKFELGASDNVLGREVQGCIIRGNNNKIGDFFLKCIFECSYIEIKNSLVPGPQTIYAQHIRILPGVRGKSSTERLVINIPDEYLNSSRELIITTKRTDGGPSTPEDIVMYYADEVADKQNKQDATLATTSKEVVGAINELFNGGVKDKSIEIGKLAQAVQDTLGKVGTNVKVLPAGTDLLSPDFEDGIWIVDCSKMTNVPSSITKSAYDYALSLLIVDREHKRVMMFGPDTNSTKYPTCAYRHLVQKSWNNTPDSIYSKLMSLQLGVDDSVKKRDDNLATTSKEVIGAINEIFNGGVKDTSISGAKLEDAAVTSTKIAARTIIGDNIQNKTIRTEQIADNAITTENINDYAVTSNKIKDGSITGYKIPNETILERHLGYWSVTKNKIAEGVVSLDKLAFSVQDTLKMVGTNVKEISYKSMGDKIPNIDDITETGIYILPNGEKYDGSTYSALPVDLRYSNVKLLIVSPTSQSGGEQRQTLIAINNSSLVGICTREAYDSTGFVNLPFSYTPIQSAIEGKIDNTSTLTDTEVNNIWDNN